MSNELMAILDHIERERGIKKEVLLAAVESAMVSAVKKAIGSKTADNISVTIDKTDGKIRAFMDKKEIENVDFGRIAAQTAKQVIIQKIREAEKDVIFNEFSAKVGDIVSGTVYRFDKGNIVVDLLGKAEGLMPKREQSPRDDFRQGQRIRAYILDVKREIKGPQIILSRTSPLFVKKLFELEVPEIFEGIVEVKSISREAGERTKIAVWSKDEKVDCVGACVGMRGSRVKDIVMELQGEKIDIIRWSDDLREYITAALSPAKITEIRLDKEGQRSQVIVADDQLSLAIGKHGQNVRLASRLIGWDLDIRTREEIVKEKEEAKKTRAEMSLDGVGEKVLTQLIDAGFDNLEKIAASTVEQLTQVKGIGEKKAEKIIALAKERLIGVNPLPKGL
ncbi:MAG: transcription termination factor NusA [Candidatus Omnitrophica bacterium CG1_02_44_16]|nr:MAG: transcription termination factor NusA [Candidatus Omnitrophica bacterium CG1_02_44_16]PIY83998.1 MAG: transcription termination/antitermination protein NusA [Candidatus Omnitrophica bacterium CG_4_10_14_0_8_um_filter_44_12]PIZ84776.1 MAG: transcription termination/antitermination protein NusA [Candidatus Omnitrophica bacterium CG_4_10_14_0_2_um_filter_44_9]